MLDSFGMGDEFLSPRDGFPLFDEVPEKCCIDGEGSRRVEVVVIGGPAKPRAKVCELGGEPVVSLALPWTIPQRQCIGLSPGEVAGMRGAGDVASVAEATNCSSAN